MQRGIALLLALAASSLIYVAVADLIPSLLRCPDLRATGRQVAMIVAGIGSVWLARRLAEQMFGAG